MGLTLIGELIINKYVERPANINDVANTLNLTMNALHGYLDKMSRGYNITRDGDNITVIRKPLSERRIAR
jgi:hypothetical protein